MWLLLLFTIPCAVAAFSERCYWLGAFWVVLTTACVAETVAHIRRRQVKPKHKRVAVDEPTTIWKA
jgi:hypothetical protein